MALGSISFGQGLASGIDFRSIIDALIRAESHPITQLQKRIDRFESAKQAFSSLGAQLDDFAGKLEALRTSSAVGGKTAAITGLASGATAPLAATASSTAIAGAYSIEITNLAQAHRVRSAGLAEGWSPLVTAGTITVRSGGNDTITVTVGAEGKSLQQIAAEINEADEGVVASVISDGTNSLLVVKSEQTGTANALTITDTTNLELAGGANNPSPTLQPAENAALTVDGVAITSQSNTISTAIPGLTLTLLAETTSALTLTVAEDVAGTKQALRDLVEAYNLINELFEQQLGAADAQRASAVASSNVFRNLQLRLQRLLTAPVENIVDGRLNTLAELGVQVADGTGALEFNEATFDRLVDQGRFAEVQAVLQRTGTTTDGSVQYVSATSVTQAGTYAVTITRAAEQATIVGSTAIQPGGLAQAENLTVTLGGASVEVALLAGDAIDVIVAKINAALDNAGVAATAYNDGGRLRLRSDEYGAAQDLTVVSDVEDLGDGQSTGVGVTPLADEGVDVEGRIGDPSSPLLTGSGRDLTGAAGSNAAGLTIRVYGTATGGRGTVSYSAGVAGLFIAEIEAVTDPFDGLIRSATEGYEASIKAAQDRIAAIQERLATRRETLTRQFAAAEQAISALNTMMASLNQQF